MRSPRARRRSRERQPWPSTLLGGASAGVDGQAMLSVGLEDPVRDTHPATKSACGPGGTELREEVDLPGRLRLVGRVDPWRVEDERDRRALFGGSLGAGEAAARDPHLSD